MSNNDDQVQRELEIIDSVAGKGPLTKAKSYLKLTGPGWLQGAITLGGGSLAGALYLGTISGYSLMWLQPLAMICGVIMLSAIAYVTLSTEQRPFGAINQHLSPLLGWSWLIGTIMANIVWAMPQFNLGRSAIQQNLMPFVGESNASTFVICLVFLVIAFFVNVLYESDGRGVKTFELILKAMVAVIVVSFFLVVFTLTIKGAVPWGQILGGLFPNFGDLFNPSSSYATLIEQSGAHSGFWTKFIASSQRDVIFTAFGTAVGINMTWLLPYSLLRKRWGRKHRDLAIFDLSIGLFVPFVLATSCVVIASASQFHARTQDVLTADGTPNAEMAGSYYKVLDARVDQDPALKEEIAAAKESLKGIAKDNPDAIKTQRAAIDQLYLQVPEAERQLTAMLAKRDNFQLATTLAPLSGDTVAQIIFGIGVLGMALSTIIILMLMNGIAFQELFGKPDHKGVHFLGCAVSGLAGVAGPFLWGNADANAALAVPTSVIGGSLIPIAYFTFLLLMNSRSVLGDKRPTGKQRVIWNTLMIGATSIATFGSIWAIKDKSFQGIPVGLLGIGFLVLLVAVGTFSFLKKEAQSTP